jgi:lysozyme
MIDAIVDLSHWQTPVDFVALRNSGILAVILKATQGSSWVDATFIQKLLAAHSAGLLLGAYHFADATPPVAQVDNFLTHASGIQFLATDFEANGMGGTVSTAQAAEIVARIHSARGRTPTVYINKYGPSGNDAGLPNSILSRCDLWVAKYTTSAVLRPTDLPPGWTNWRLWQHVDAPLDRSRFNGTADELKTYWDS